MPPPTPKSALKKPATRPIRTRRTGLCYERGRDDGRAARASDGGARGSSPLSRLRRRARADRRASGGRVSAARDARRACATRRPLRARRRRQRARGRRRPRAASPSTASLSSARTGSSSTARQIAGGSRSRTSPDAAAWPPSEIELKGLSVAFHFRHRDDEAAAVLELEAIAEAARDEGLVARFGRKVLEVLPPVGSNKGTAVRHLLEGAGLTRALVAGDDTTDLDAFRAVEELEHRVRVAVRRARVAGGCSPSMPSSCSARPASSSSCCAGSSARRATRCSRRCASGSASRSSCRGTARSASSSGRSRRYNAARTHDVTLFILDPSRRLALIRKPHFADDVWRPPGGGIKPGEDFVAGAVREALEETGLHVELRRYLVASRAVFRNAGRELPWRTHVFLAETADDGARAERPGRDRGCALGTLSTSSADRLRADAPRDRPRVLALPRRPARRGSVAVAHGLRPSHRRSDP